MSGSYPSDPRVCSFRLSSSDEDRGCPSAPTEIITDTALAASAARSVVCASNIKVGGQDE